jgi:trehalose 6-phosphate synthase/phosphatase
LNITIRAQPQIIKNAIRSVWLRVKMDDKYSSGNKFSWAPKKRIIIVSNRLPFTVREEAGDLKFAPSVGGLATGISSYLEYLRYHPALSMDYLWVGWPGSTIPQEEKKRIQAKALSEFNSLPVFLSEEEIEEFYQGFCNKTIWPLFHYFPAYTKYDEDQWNHYIEVNRNFCRTLLDILRPDDTLWIHDYHLMLLPAMIREQSPSATIGFFLHIPFPNFEIFRLLPRKWRKQILEGLVGADLIGFHTNDYKQDFLRCVLRILGYGSDIGEIIVGGRVVKAETFPMGIDFEKYHSGACYEKIRLEKDEIHDELREAKIVLSIDRLDYSKGIVNRLEAFQIFLEAWPQWQGKVVLLLIVVPSRVDVEHYEMMKNEIERLVGMINGKFGSPGWTPIVYMFKALTFAPLVAMYSASQIALITPLRDGMNLIAKEYVAAREDKTGVLILSEMAGASKELLEAVIINPNDRHEIAEAIAEALEMPVEEQIRRNTVMQERLMRYDVVRWAADFMGELSSMEQGRNKYIAKVLSSADRTAFIDKYCRSSSRLLLLDYDGTLVPFSVNPENAVPSQSLVDILNALARDPKNEVVLVSGRRKDFLDQWFSKLPISLVAEHGAWIKRPDQAWAMAVPMVHDWKPRLKPLLERYVNRVAGTTVEEKDFALVWHYRGAEAEPGRLAAQELKDHLLALTANMDLHILQGNKTVEIRIAGTTKATGSLPFLSHGQHDLILCLGDDQTDEDLFAVLPEMADSIRVGLGNTCARRTMPDVEAVVSLLKEVSLAGSVSPNAA